MALDDIKDLKEELVLDKEHREKWIGVYIGVLAVLLAICGMGGANATKESTRTNIEATNIWAFFQAKNLRRYGFMIAADEMELTIAAQAAMPADARKAFEERIKAYRANIATLNSDPKSNEGLDQLWARGKALERERDIALRRDPYFDWAQALLQIAIVLATVSLVTASLWILWLSGGLAVFGALLLVNGYTLIATLPIIG